MNPHDHIIITGASGMLGSNLTKALIDAGFKKLTLPLRTHSQLPNTLQHESSIQIARLDMYDHFQVMKVLEGVDYIFHCAGATSGQTLSKDQLIEANITLSRTWVDAALESDIKGWVHFSSAAALGRKKDGSPCSEKDSWQKNEVYSDYNKSKFLGEVEAARGLAEGLPVIILNPSYMIGDGGYMAMVQQYLSYPFPTLPSGMGGFVSVEDVARFAIRAAQASLWGEKFILNAENLLHKEVFSWIAEANQLQLPNRTAHGLKKSLYRLSSSLQQFPPFDWLKMLESKFAYDANKSLETGLIAYQPIKSLILKHSLA